MSPGISIFTVLRKMRQKVEIIYCSGNFCSISATVVLYSGIDPLKTEGILRKFPKVI
jgi:hypothetical protein